ncbi:MAG: NAD(P)/FAD-dependent oxidoreductase [Desulfovibrionaceae bacterium]|nr:NAD(P)/FAD-dependent oxidoreductase [Desulfovibrionaceae bacterium]MBF0514228.1 NAD(P)/FAD-dependent oxidoreductase [Desulfovibrionaceae bacterium]
MESRQLVIVGGGPAGLSAAIYTARANVDTLLIGCAPKVAGDYEIDNYFGFPETINGRELIERGKRQAERFGAVLDCDTVLGMHHGESGGFVVKAEKREIACKALILATGVARLAPKIPGLADYEAKGVSYCVSCDGFFHRGQPVAVAGEGIYAANQALELTAYTKDISIVTNGKKSEIKPEFQARLDRAGIPVIEARIEGLSGEAGLESVRLEGGRELPAHGLFIAMGAAGSGDFANTLGLAREGAFIIADPEQRTNIEGVFAAGDCTGGFLQISVAVGEGAKAGRGAINFLKKGA